MAGGTQQFSVASLLPPVKLLEMYLSHKVGSLYHTDFKWDEDEQMALKLQYLTTVYGYDYRKSKFFETPAQEEEHNQVFNVMGHSATLLNVFSNSLVILVFVRVIGLKRLPSRVLVNLSAAMLFEALAELFQATQSWGMLPLKDVATCRFVTQFTQNTWQLFHITATAGFTERILALNLPTFYNRGIQLIGPTILVCPWVYFIATQALFNLELQFDLGYECNKHLNVWLPDDSMSAGSQGSFFIGAFVFMVLSTSLLFQTRKSGDVMESNLYKFEAKTTSVLIKIYLLYSLFGVPLLLSSMFANPEEGLARHVRVYHMAHKVMVFRGVSVLVILLGRDEFKHQLLQIFESAEVIRRNKTANLLLVSQSQTSHMDLAKRDEAYQQDRSFEKFKPKPAALIPRGRQDMDFPFPTFK